MFRASLTVLAVLAATPAVASAGGYLTAGVGSSADLGGDLAAISSDASSAKVGVGQRIGPFGVEAALTGYGVQEGTAISASASAKLHADLFAGLGAYARAGLERGWVRAEQMDMSGTGYVLGVGLDFGLSFLLGEAALWVEAQREYLDFDRNMSGTADLLLAGVRVGI